MFKWIGFDMVIEILKFYLDQGLGWGERGDRK